MEDIFDQAVTHCFKITNSGDTYLTSFDVQNPAIGFSKTLSSTLAPGESTIVYHEGKITTSAVNTASVTATAVLEDGSWPGSENVHDNDTAEIVKLEFEASVEVTNTVSRDERIEIVADRSFAVGL